MERVVVIFLMLFLVTSCTSSRKVPEKEFYIVFGSCFKDDNVSLLVNDVMAFKGEILNSDFSTGIVLNVSVEYQLNELITRVDANQKSATFQVGETIKLSINKNGHEHPFNMNLSNGKHILIENCESTLTAKQFKKKLIFE